ncbi:putative RNA-binding protein [groundwater metagenome]
MITFGKKAEKEEFTYILDYLPYGRTDDKRPMYQKKPLAQGIGEKYFVLMEMIPKENVIPMSHDRVYIGEGDRPVIDHVKRRIIFGELTRSAQMELPSVIEKIILSDEKRFLNFFNDAYPITTRLHMLELLPGIGKKLMWAIIDERKKGKFESTAQLVSRVKGLHAPEKLLTNRILEELKEGNIKYRIFTTPMPPKR